MTLQEALGKLKDGELIGIRLKKDVLHITRMTKLPMWGESLHRKDVLKLEHCTDERLAFVINDLDQEPQSELAALGNRRPIDERVDSSRAPGENGANDD